MARVSVEDVTKVYGEDVVALDDVSFEVEDGEFVVLLGPSGAGKSTLLRLLNGLTGPTEGAVTIGDDLVIGTRTDVAMVFQMHYLVEGLSAYRNALTGALGRTETTASILNWYGQADKEMALEALTSLTGFCVLG